MSPPRRVGWSAPLSEYGPGFVAEVQRLGFTPLSVEHQSRLFAHLSRWMQSQGLEVGQLTSARVDEFLVERRATHTNRYSRKSQRTLPGFRNRLGVLPVEEPVAPTPNELVVAAFERNQVGERGLLPSTVAAQVARVRRFLDRHCPPGGVVDLSTAEVTAALLAEGTDHAVSSVKRMGYTLRSFLRYAFLTGLIDQDLSGAAIPVRSHQPSLLPIGISREQPQALLGACDPDTAGGTPRLRADLVAVSARAARHRVRRTPAWTTSTGTTVRSPRTDDLAG
jgi:integrase/recombinase XerD